MTSSSIHFAINNKIAPFFVLLFLFIRQQFDNLCYTSVGKRPLQGVLWQSFVSRFAGSVCREWVISHMLGLWYPFQYISFNTINSLVNMHIPETPTEPSCHVRSITNDMLLTLGTKDYLRIRKHHQHCNNNFLLYFSILLFFFFDNVNIFF